MLHTWGAGGSGSSPTEGATRGEVGQNGRQSVLGSIGVRVVILKRPRLKMLVLVMILSLMRVMMSLVILGKLTLSTMFLWPLNLTLKRLNHQ